MTGGPGAPILATCAGAFSRPDVCSLDPDPINGLRAGHGGLSSIIWGPHLGPPVGGRYGGCKP